MREPKILHPELTPEERARLLVSGVELFNAGEHYAAHDAWEEVWRSTQPEPKRLLQGLIQAAAGLYQIQKLGRRSGPKGTLAKAVNNLTLYAAPDLPLEERLGLEVAELVADLEKVRSWLEAEEGNLPIPTLKVTNLESLR